MNIRLLSFAVIGVVVLVAGSYFIIAPYAKRVEDKQANAYIQSKQNISANVPAISMPQGIVSTDSVIAIENNEQPQLASSNNEVVIATPEVTPTLTTPKPPTVPVAVSGYTTTQVAVHDGQTSCWSSIDGKVYDLTSWIKQHPGGERNILKICGKDGTKAFEGQHEGDSKPEKTLATFYIGALIK